MTSHRALRIRPSLAATLIGIAALFVRLLHVLSYDSAPANDMAVYVRMAVRNLALANLLTPEGLCWFPPGYAFFLKPLFLAFSPEAALTAVKVAQAALGAWSCVLVYRLARRIGSTLAGLAAALATAFYPHFLFYASAYMSETLFIALFYAAMLALLRAGERPAARRLFTAGLLAGAALLVRPAAAALAPAALFACLRAAPDRRGRLRALSFIAAGGITLLAPWALRNLIAYDRLVVVAPNGAFNLAIGNHPNASGRYTMPPSIAGDLWERSEDFRARALQFVVEDPAGALFVVMRLKWLAFWETIPPWPLYSSNPMLFVGHHFFPFLSWRSVFVAGSLGLGMLAARRREGWWVTPACFAAYAAVFLVFFGNARFRLPAEGLFLAWAGVAVATALRGPVLLRRLDRGRWGAIAALLVAAILAQGGASGASVRRQLARPESILATGEQFPILPNRGERVLFGEEALSLDRGRGRFLELGMQIYRMGPHRDSPDNGLIRLVFLDRRGRPLSWLENTTLFLEALPSDRWVRVAFRSHIPPAAASIRPILLPDPGSPDTVIVDATVLRYSPGNDCALESLFPYLQYAD